MSEYKYKLPDVGEGVVEAEIVEWHIKEGDKVTEDQHILDVMTDKATVEIPCAVNGVVKKIVGAPGDVIPVGTEILVIEIDGSPPTEEEAPAPEVKEEAKPAADPEKGKALAEGPDRTADKSEDPAGGKQAAQPAKPAVPSPKALPPPPVRPASGPWPAPPCVSALWRLILIFLLCRAPARPGALPMRTWMISSPLAGVWRRRLAVRPPARHARPARA